MNRTGRFYLKSGLVIIFTVFCILFGVSLASSGMERVYGPMDSEQVDKAAIAKEKQQAQDLEKEKKKLAEAEAQKAKLTYEEIRLARNQTEHSSLFGSLGKGLGSLVKQLASLIVSFFSAIFDLFV